MALPAIGQRIALMGMEVANELGAVQLLGIPSLSAASCRPGRSMGIHRCGGAGPDHALHCADASGGRTLAASPQSRWSEGVAGGESPAWTLQGGRAVIAQCLGALPPLISLGIPLTWAGINAEQLTRGFEPELVLLTVRSLGLALAATLLAGCAVAALDRQTPESIQLAEKCHLPRWNGVRDSWCRTSASPPTARRPWQLSPILLLLWGYSDRFLAEQRRH